MFSTCLSVAKLIGYAYFLIGVHLKEEIAFFIGKESQLPGNRLSKVGYIILEKMVSYISIKDVMQ